MRTPTRIGIASLSFAALGLLAPVALAPVAGAATAQAGSANYDSKATAAIGGLVVPVAPDSALSVTAVTQPGGSDSPQQAGLGAGKVLPALKSAPGAGAALIAALKAANPGGTQLAEVQATSDHYGHSTACASLLSADCGPGQARPLTLRLGLSDLTSGLSALPLAGLTRELPDPLADYSVVVTIAGPQATCTAGPAGSGQLASADTAARATVDLQDKGKSLLPAGAAPVTHGSVLRSLLGAVQNAPLDSALSAVTEATPLTLNVSEGSRSASGSTATATTGRVALTSGTVRLLDLKSATVSCGGNTVDPHPYTPSDVDNADSVAGTGSMNYPDGLVNTDPALQGLTNERQPLGPVSVPSIWAAS